MNDSIRIPSIKKNVILVTFFSLLSILCLNINNMIIALTIFTFFFLSQIVKNVFPLIFLVILIVPDEVLYYYSDNPPEYGFGFFRIHPIVLPVVLLSLQYFLKNKKHFNSIFHNSWMKNNIILLFLFLLFAFIQTFLFRGLQGQTILIENYLAPIFLMFWAYTYFNSLERKKRTELITITYKTITLFIFFIAIYGIFEYYHKNNIIYGPAIENLEWSDTMTNPNLYRITSFFGHPLKNSYYYLFAFICGLSLFKCPINIIISITSFIALLFTGSRIGVLLIMLAILLLFINNIKKFATFLLCLMFIIFLLKTPLANLIFYRLSKETVSAQVRVETSHNLLNLVRDNFFTGNGLGSSTETSRTILSTRGSFENPWAMLIADVGFFTTALYLLFLIRVFYSSVKTFNYNFIISFVLLVSFSSFSSHFRNTLNFLFLFNIAIIMINSTEALLSKIKK